MVLLVGVESVTDMGVLIVQHYLFSDVVLNQNSPDIVSIGYSVRELNNQAETLLFDTLVVVVAVILLLRRDYPPKTEITATKNFRSIGDSMGTVIDLLEFF